MANIDSKQSKPNHLQSFSLDEFMEKYFKDYDPNKPIKGGSPVVVRSYDKDGNFEEFDYCFEKTKCESINWWFEKLIHDVYFYDIYKQAGVASVAYLVPEIIWRHGTKVQKINALFNYLNRIHGKQVQLYFKK